MDAQQSFDFDFGLNTSLVIPYSNGSKYSQLPNDSVFFLHYNVFNPRSILYTNEPSEFGISVGLLKFIVEGVGVTSLSFFGLIGNILSILVLSSAPMWESSTSFYLRCLAICDTFVILSAALFAGIPSLIAFNPDGGKVNEIWLMFNKRIVEYSKIVPTPPVYTTGVLCSILFIMALTMDRYLAICKPFLARKHNLCTRTRARNVSLFLFIGNVLYNLPRYWENEYIALETEFDNLTAYVPAPTSLRKNFYYDALYIHISCVFTLFLAPLVYLVVFNIIIYKEIRASRKLRKSMGSSSSPQAKPRDHSLAYMLFGVVIVFILCQIIPATFGAYRYAAGNVDVGTEDYVPEIEFIMIFMVVLNSSVNFLIYCVSGSKFRNAMLHLWKNGMCK